jgi:hypothetical protein
MSMLRNVSNGYLIDTPERLYPCSYHLHISRTFHNASNAPRIPASNAPFPSTPSLAAAPGDEVELAAVPVALALVVCPAARSV